MPRRPSTFRQRDLRVAMDEARRHGASRVLIDKAGKIEIVITGDSASQDENEWDRATQ